MTVWRVTLAYTAPSAASAAATIKRKLEGRHRGPIFAVLRVEDEAGVTHWTPPGSPRRQPT